MKKPKSSKILYQHKFYFLIVINCAKPNSVLFSLHLGPDPSCAWRSSRFRFQSLDINKMWKTIPDQVEAMNAKKISVSRPGSSIISYWIIFFSPLLTECLINTHGANIIKSLSWKTSTRCFALSKRWRGRRKKKCERTTISKKKVEKDHQTGEEIVVVGGKEFRVAKA